MPKTKITKKDFIGKVAEKVGMSQKDTERVLNAIAEVVAAELRPGKKEVAVTVPGLAKFTKKKVKARKARLQPHPVTGEPMNVPAQPAHWTLRASAVRPLKEAI